MNAPKKISEDDVLNHSGVLIVQAEATIQDALERMTRANVGSIIVMTGDEVSGIVTERDVLKHWKDLSKPNFLKQPISQIMSNPVQCLLSNELYRAAIMMLDKKIRHIPIIGSQKKLIGVMSIRDVLKNYHLYAQPHQDLPLSNPIDPRESDKKPTYHLVNPTHNLEVLLKDLYEKRIHFKPWNDLHSFVGSTEFKENNEKPIFIDLDNIQKELWIEMLKQLLANLKHAHPQLFIFLTPDNYGIEETDKLKALSQKVNWHVYTRPVSIAALTHDLSKLKLQ